MIECPCCKNTLNFRIEATEQVLAYVTQDARGAATITEVRSAQDPTWDATDLCTCRCCNTQMTVADFDTDLRGE